MIEGLKFQIQPQELRDHLSARIAHHTERTQWYSQKADELVAGGLVAANMTGGDPVGAMRTKQREHDNQIRLFTWMRDHVVEEPYQLADADLTRLEILNRGW